MIPIFLVQTELSCLARSGPGETNYQYLIELIHRPLTSPENFPAVLRVLTFHWTLVLRTSSFSSRTLGGRLILCGIQRPNIYAALTAADTPYLPHVCHAGGVRENGGGFSSTVTQEWRGQEETCSPEFPRGYTHHRIVQDLAFALGTVGSSRERVQAVRNGVQCTCLPWVILLILTWHSLTRTTSCSQSSLIASGYQDKKFCWTMMDVGFRTPPNPKASVRRRIQKSSRTQSPSRSTFTSKPRVVWSRSNVSQLVTRFQARRT